MTRALRRWLTFLRVVHGRRPLVVGGGPEILFAHTRPAIAAANSGDFR